MTDLISRAVAIKAFTGKPPEYYATSYIVGELKDIPAVDAVPVVRCKDCRYWDKDDSDRELCMCKVLGTRTLPICFCWAGLPWEDREVGNT